MPRASLACTRACTTSRGLTRLHPLLPAFARGCLLPGADTCDHACMIVTVAAAKGGVGKTTIAYELAAVMGAVLVDLDWDSGGATRMWGYDAARFRTAPLLDGFEAGVGGPAPRPRTRRHQPSLVPSHRDLAASSIPDDLVADCLAAWAKEWDVPVVVDTHPGANTLSDGAMQVADLVVVPVILAAREMDALAGMLDDFGATYTLLLAPTMVPHSPPRRYVERLAELAGSTPVAAPISEHRWLRRRVRRAALTLQPNPGRQVLAAANEFRRLAETVEATNV